MRLLTAVLIASVALASCGRRVTPARGAEAERSKLEAADAADGAQDRVVARCAVCGLAMQGMPEHVSRYEGYELRFCSAECKETFDRDPHAVLRRLHPPAP